MKKRDIILSPATGILGQLALSWIVPIAVVALAFLALVVPGLAPAQVATAAANLSPQGAPARFVILEKFGYPS